MWHRVKHFFFSLNTYNVLSPDLKVRQQVNRALNCRTALSSEDWFTKFYQAQGIANPVVIFTYRYMQQYSGLDFSRVLPTDRFYEDLRWSDVCWFDWTLQLYDDFWQQFGVDLSDCFDESGLSTVEALIVCLNQATHRAALATPDSYTNEKPLPYGSEGYQPILPTVREPS